MSSIPERIIGLLGNESPLTIKRITEGLGEQKRGRSVRVAVYRLLDKGVIIQEMKMGKEYLYTLKEKAKNSRILLKQLYEIMNKMMFRNDIEISDSEIETVEKIKEMIE